MHQIAGMCSIRLKSLLALLLLTGSCFAGGSVTLKGLIETAEEDDNYKPVSVNLMVDKIVKDKVHTEYYRIVNEGPGVELLDLVDKRVTITGTLSGAKSLKVISYTLSDPSDSKPEKKAEPEEDLVPAASEAAPEEDESGGMDESGGESSDDE